MNVEEYAAAVMNYAIDRLDNEKGVSNYYDYEADISTGVMRALDDLIDFLKELNTTNNIKN